MGTSGGLFDMARKHQEAQAVRLGLPIDRKFSDDELVESIRALAEAEHDLALEFGGMSTAERLCALSAEEQRQLAELTRKLIPFRVTITLQDRTEKLNVLATDSCMATIRVFELVFGELDTEKPESFKLKVEPVKVRGDQRRAA